MNLIRRILATDPILFRNAITSVALLLASFGLQIGDADVNAAVDAVLNLIALGNIALAFLDRSRVYSPETHEQDVARAFNEGIRVGAGADA